MGHKVYATVGSDERARAVEALGAVQAINYRTQDYVEEVKKATDGKGVNVVLDMVAGEYVNRNINCLADDGRIFIIALLGGAKAYIYCSQIQRRRLTFHGTNLTPAPDVVKREIPPYHQTHAQQT